MWQAGWGRCTESKCSRLDKWGDVASAFWHGFWMDLILCHKPVETMPTNNPDPTMHIPLSTTFLTAPSSQTQASSFTSLWLHTNWKKSADREWYCIIKLTSTYLKSQTIRTGKANSNKDCFTKQLCKNRLAEQNEEEQGKSNQKKEEEGLNFTTKS